MWPDCSLAVLFPSFFCFCHPSLPNWMSQYSRKVINIIIIASDWLRYHSQPITGLQSCHKSFENSSSAVPEMVKRDPESHAQRTAVLCIILWWLPHVHNITFKGFYFGKMVSCLLHQTIEFPFDTLYWNNSHDFEKICFLLSYNLYR